jgi:uncharacterized membrane protein YqgA involved in biofilm formation
MVIALSAFSSTFGLVVVFFVILPAIAQGLIAFAAAQAFGERAENEEYRGATGITEDQRIV